MSSTINVCNYIAQLEGISSADIVRNFLKKVEANVTSDVWGVLSDIKINHHKNALEKDQFNSTLHSLERYLNEFVQVHLQDGHHFSDQLRSRTTTVHKEGRAVMMKHLDYLKKIMKKIKPMSGEFEKYLEQEGHKISEEDAAKHALTLVDFIGVVLSVSLVVLSLCEALHLKEKYSEAAAEAGIVAAQFNRIVLPLVERAFHNVNPTFVAEHLFQKKDKGLGKAGTSVRKLVYEVILCDVLFCTMDFVIFPKSIKAHNAGIRCIQVAPPDLVGETGSQYILTGSDDTMVKIHSIDGKQFANFSGFNSIVSFCTFVPPYDQQVFATSFDCTACVWDTCTGKRLARLKGHRDSILDGSVNKKGSLALTASMDGTVRLWCLKEYRCLRMYRFHATGKWIKSVQFTMRGDDVFASAGLDNRLVFAKAEKPTPKARHERSLAYMKLKEWTSRNNSAPNNKTVFDVEETWPEEPETAFVIKAAKVSSDYILDMRAYGPRNTLVVASKDRMLTVFDTSPNSYTTRYHETNQAPTWASCLSLSHDGTMIAAGSSDNFICLYNIDSGICMRQFRVHMEGLMHVAFLNDDKILACGCSSGRVVFLNLSDD